MLHNCGLIVVVVSFLFFEFLSANYVDNSAEPVVPAFSFLPPFDEKNPSVSNFKLQGAAALKDSHVRLTPMLPGNDGALWNINPVKFNAWEVSLDFRVTGERFLGGDGFAFWYTKEKELRGHTFGNYDNFNGLAIIFDTYDNDGKRDNPSISAFNFDGTEKYDVDTDGEQKRLDGAFCRVSFRNARRPAHVKIAYSQPEATLSVYYDVRGNGHFQQCFVVKDVKLETGGYFGITAHTGDVADNHDIHSIAVRNLQAANEPEAEEAPAHAHIEELPKTDLQRLEQLSNVVSKWQALSFDERDKLLADRKNRVKLMRDEAKEEGEGEHDHEHDHDDEKHEHPADNPEDDDEEGGGSSSGKFETKVVQQLKRIQTTLSDLFAEVEEVGKGVADVNFDINTNVIPALSKDKTAAAAAAGSASTPTASTDQQQQQQQQQQPGAKESIVERNVNIDYERMEHKMKDTGDNVVRQVSDLIQDQSSKIKALGQDIAEIKSVVKNRLGQNQQQDEEIASKISMMTNEITKLKAMVKALSDSRESNSESLRTQAENLEKWMNESTGSSSSLGSVVVYIVAQLVILGVYLLWKRIQDQKKMHLL